MRKPVAIASSLLLAFLLITSKTVVSSEQFAHHGQLIANDGNPNGCIACHDGLTASSVHFCTVECGFGSSHPISREYPPRSKETSYAPVESLDEKGIRLYDGKVSCVSCHDLTKTTKYHLIVNDGGKTFCFMCHRI